MTAPRTFGLREVSEKLGVHYMTVYRHVRTGRVAAEWDGAGWRLPVAELNRVLRAPSRRRGRGRGAEGSPRIEELTAPLIAGDEAGAWWVVEGALASGSTAPAICIDAFVPAMQRATCTASRPPSSPTCCAPRGTMLPTLAGTCHRSRPSTPGSAWRGVARLSGVAIAVTNPACARAVRPTGRALHSAGITAVTVRLAGADGYTSTAQDVVQALTRSDGERGS